MSVTTAEATPAPPSFDAQPQGHAQGQVPLTSAPTALSPNPSTSQESSEVAPAVHVTTSALNSGSKVITGSPLPPSTTTFSAQQPQPSPHSHHVTDQTVNHVQQQAYAGSPYQHVASPSYVVHQSQHTQAYSPHSHQTPTYSHTGMHSPVASSPAPSSLWSALLSATSPDREAGERAFCFTPTSITSHGSRSPSQLTHQQQGTTSPYPAPALAHAGMPVSVGAPMNGGPQSHNFSPYSSSAQASPSSRKGSGLGSAKKRIRMSARSSGKGKPTYASLIAMAIEFSNKKQLMLQEIYDYVEKRLSLLPPEAQDVDANCWKNSIRHNLSLRKCFVKVPRKDDSGKKLSSYWMLDKNHLPSAAIKAIAGYANGDVPVPVPATRALSKKKPRGAPTSDSGAVDLSVASDKNNDSSGPLVVPASSAASQGTGVAPSLDSSAFASQSSVAMDNKNTIKGECGTVPQALSGREAASATPHISTEIQNEMKNSAANNVLPHVNKNRDKKHAAANVECNADIKKEKKQSHDEADLKDDLKIARPAILRQPSESRVCPQNKSLNTKQVARSTTCFNHKVEKQNSESLIESSSPASLLGKMDSRKSEAMSQKSALVTNNGTRSESSAKQDVQVGTKRKRDLTSKRESKRDCAKNINTGKRKTKSQRTVENAIASNSAKTGDAKPVVTSSVAENSSSNEDKQKFKEGDVVMVNFGRTYYIGNVIQVSTQAPGWYLVRYQGLGSGRDEWKPAAELQFMDERGAGKKMDSRSARRQARAKSSV